MKNRDLTVEYIANKPKFNDSTPDDANRYGEKFSIIVKTLRDKLNVPNIPIILGGLGDFLTQGNFLALIIAFT
jgi:hypothetical protein